MRNLYEQRAAALQEARQILDTAEKEKRELTASESSRYDAIDNHIDFLGQQIDKSERLAKSKSRQTLPTNPNASAEPLKISYDGFAVGRMLKGRGERSNVFAAGSLQALRTADAYKKSFLGYLGGNDRQSLQLQVSKDQKGGYLAPMGLATELIKFLDNEVFVRQLATVLPPMAQTGSLGVPSWDTDPGDADWTAEVPASAISADTSTTIGRREFLPHLLTKLIRMSTKLLRSSVIDVEQLIVERLGYVFAITEEQAFLTGNGADKPLGVFTASDAGVSTSRDTTASATTSFTGDDVIDCLMNLKFQYQRNATWVVSRAWLKMCRKLKDGTGQYLLQPGLAAGVPGTIMDRPYIASEYAPSTFTTGQYVAVVGDFRTGYWIADSLDLEIQRLAELFALTNQVGIVARKETDGMPVLAEAFSRMKLA